MAKAQIYFIEKNAHGAYVIYGDEGVKQYYGYTKREATKLYRESGKTITNK